MTAKVVSKQIDNQLRQYPWYVSTGIARINNKDTIHIYVTRSANSRILNQFVPNYQGFDVITQRTGYPKPVSNHA